MLAQGRKRHQKRRVKAMELLIHGKLIVQLRMGKEGYILGSAGTRRGRSERLDHKKSADHEPRKKRLLDLKKHAARVTN